MTALFKRALLVMLPTLLAVAGIVFTALWHPQAESRNNNPDPTVIVLTASWCGTCREITPLVRRIAASEPGVDVVVLDVDSSSAPREASQYGISVAGEVPQVYLYNNGKTTLLFSGKGYRIGQSKQAEQQIRQKLEENL